MRLLWAGDGVGPCLVVRCQAFNKGINISTQLFRIALKCFRNFGHLCCDRTGSAGRPVDGFKAGIDIPIGRGNCVDVATDFGGGGGLLFNGGRNSGYGINNRTDLPRDFTDRRHSRTGACLNRINLFGDIACCLGGLIGKILDLACDHGKAFACFTRAGSLNRRI